MHKSLATAMKYGFAGEYSDDGLIAVASNPKHAILHCIFLILVVLIRAISIIIQNNILSIYFFVASFCPMQHEWRQFSSRD
jgi:hypothetical protein